MKGQEEFNIEFSRTLGRIEGKLDNLVGDDGRISALEKDHVRNWWFTVCIAPFLATVHAILRHFKLNV